MEKFKINKAADILYNSRINIKRIKELPKDCTPKSFQEAYAIQDELTKRYLSEDKKNLVIGKKIGCTNEAAKMQLNIKDSFFGNMFSDNISRSNSIINPKKYEINPGFVLKGTPRFKCRTYKNYINYYRINIDLIFSYFYWKKIIYIENKMRQDYHH